MQNNLIFERKFGYEVWPQAKINEAFKFAEGYRQFLSVAKTEREVVDWTVRAAQAHGFEEFSAKTQANRFYQVNRGKSIVLGVFGQKPVTDGVRLILAHIDSPRIDLKPMPLYESEKIAWLKTQYYGGIKKYQWPTLPLSIHGPVVLANGKTILLTLGEQENEPVLTITDLLPHLSKEQMEKKLSEAVAGEEMNIIIGSRPAANSKAKDSNSKLKNEKDAIKLGVLELLNQRYGITEEDLVSADLEIVPAGPARDLGLDASLILGYGQDDRLCAYSALQAMFALDDPVRSIVIALLDREETGSESNTGALSRFLPDFLAEMIYRQTGRQEESLLRQTLWQTKALSADVTAGYDPDYASAFDPQNTARIGAGVVIEKYVGSRGKSGTSEASAEYLAEIRKIFNKNSVLWQTGGLGKVDLGGGGTVAMFLARYNLDVVDIGVPLLSMHSPYEVSSKVDLYAAFEAYKAFLKD